MNQDKIKALTGAKYQFKGNDLTITKKVNGVLFSRIYQNGKLSISLNNFADHIIEEQRNTKPKEAICIDFI